MLPSNNSELLTDSIVTNLSRHCGILILIYDKSFANLGNTGNMVGITHNRKREITYHIRKVNSFKRLSYIPACNHRISSLENLSWQLTTRKQYMANFMIRTVNSAHDIHQKLKVPAAKLKRLSANLSHFWKYIRRCVNNYTRTAHNHEYTTEKTLREDITKVTTVEGKWVGNPKPPGRYLSITSGVIAGRVKNGWKYFTQCPYMIQQGEEMNMSKNEQTWATSELYRTQFAKNRSFGEMTQVTVYFARTIWTLTQNDICKQTAEITSSQPGKWGNKSVTRYMDRKAMSKASTHGHAILQNKSKRHTPIEMTTSYTDITDNTTEKGKWMASPNLLVCPLIPNGVITGGNAVIKLKYSTLSSYTPQRVGRTKMCEKGQLWVTSELHEIQFVKNPTFGKKTRLLKFFRGKYPEYIQNDLCTQKAEIFCMRKGRRDKESVTRYTEPMGVGKMCTHGMLETFLNARWR